jgi:2-dehydro-3-deoxy-D-arabinonate dehydratase
MKLYNTTKGILLQTPHEQYILQGNWDEVVNQPHLHNYLQEVGGKQPVSSELFEGWVNHYSLPPIGSQEVWAAGVTYLRSRDARMEEAKASGGGDFYDKVYVAQRPELFFKAPAYRVVGNRAFVRIRTDSHWNVPEPELTLFINAQGSIQGYTIGNDMSSRSIEGENPLYLPQAKVYNGSAALGPCLYVPAEPIARDTVISIVINRNGVVMFSDSILLNRMKRELPELAEYLFYELDFEKGAYLMTGTGMVPSSDFTLAPGDEIFISIEGIGTLANTVAMG